MASRKPVLSLLQIPEDCLVGIFCHLDLHDIAVVARSCRTFRTAVESPILWHAVCYRMGISGAEFSDKLNWKRLAQENILPSGQVVCARYEYGEIVGKSVPSFPICTVSNGVNVLCGVDASGRVFVERSDSVTEIHCPDAIRMRTCATGPDHIALIDTAGHLWCFMFSNSELVLIDDQHIYTQACISYGAEYMLALTNQGQLFATTLPTSWYKGRYYRNHPVATGEPWVRVTTDPVSSAYCLLPKCRTYVAVIDKLIIDADAFVKLPVLYNQKDHFPGEVIREICGGPGLFIALTESGKLLHMKEDRSFVLAKSLLGLRIEQIACGNGMWCMTNRGELLQNLYCGDYWSIIPQTLARTTDIRPHQHLQPATSTVWPKHCSRVVRIDTSFHGLVAICVDRNAKSTSAAAGHVTHSATRVVGGKAKAPSATKLPLAAAPAVVGVAKPATKPQPSKPHPTAASATAVVRTAPIVTSTKPARRK